MPRSEPLTRATMHVADPSPLLRLNQRPRCAGAEPAPPIETPASRLIFIRIDETTRALTPLARPGTHTRRLAH